MRNANSKSRRGICLLCAVDGRVSKRDGLCFPCGRNARREGWARQDQELVEALALPTCYRPNGLDDIED